MCVLLCIQGVQRSSNPSDRDFAIFNMFCELKINMKFNF